MRRNTGPKPRRGQAQAAIPHGEGAGLARSVETGGNGMGAEFGGVAAGVQKLIKI
ncbi:hypothetical protein GCM10010909_31470 [Acidocella aquatica]|uniref:Uncharacterized protein n=1 Tax=Acidocella aquatica TaxID=1922313 RepID=A0ABQ6A8H2_9PROT|nr:hypothetical protein GCM10010909_31470 [Acidocella aquatica]